MVVCAAKQASLEKLRFASVDGVEIIPFRQSKEKIIEMHLRDNNPVLCMGILPAAVVKEEYAENVYWYMEYSPFRYKDLLERLDSKVHLLVSDMGYRNDLNKLFGRDAEYITPDANCYIKSFSKRKIPLLFVGNYLAPKDGEDLLDKSVSKWIRPLLEKAILKSKHNYRMSMEQIWKEVLMEEDLAYDQKLIDELLMLYQDEIIGFIERISTEKAIKTLIDKGHTITVIGENWEVLRGKLSTELQDKIVVEFPWIENQHIMEALKRTQVMLGVDRSTCEGLSVLNQLALNQGCAIVVERNSVTEHLENEGYRIVTYSAEKVGECGKKINKAIKMMEEFRKEEQKKNSPLVEWLIRN